MALITTLANAYGGRWFDEQWKPQFDQPEWKDALNYYVNTLKQSGPPGASSNGFNENLALFNSGKCAIWVDASVAGSFVTDKKQSKVADNVGFTYAPHEVTDKGSSWLYSWSLAIPTSAKNAKDAAEFTQWATSKEYARLVADTDGVSNVPPGTRASTYTDEYKKAAPFANITLESLKVANPKAPTLKPVPYVGIQLVTIPEFQAIGTSVGQQFSAALIG
ncbi:Mannitol ABC transporter periplasmic mannitol-binding protein [Pseudomonas cannabina]|nr:Mannitol ABC transporter periplasmic mannitol-binding protein [Pseudomonas cannabina]RMN29989.1 Mannitol ABC transporter periplasmic mannitol-binding protein [Pseudomonas cannabina]